jgi:hypothetical protein
MGTMKSTAKKAHRKARLASRSEKAMTNRAGGVAFDIEEPTIKLLTMTGGSFFGEPRFYSANSCVPTRDKSGRFSKMQARIQLSSDKAVKFARCDELDDVAKEIISTAVNILETPEPTDVLRVANWLRNEGNIRLTPQVLTVLSANHPNGKEGIREYVPKVVVRPDEVKTMMLLHRFFFGMKPLPSGLSLGLGDALSKFDERALLKYNTPGYPTWKDVLCTLRGRKADWPLKQALARFFQFGELDGRKTPVVYAFKKLAQKTEFDNEAKALAEKCGVTWEVLVSQFGKNPAMKRKVWAYLVEKRLIGYMAVLRNLRNMLEAGVSTGTIAKVAEFLSNRNAVLKSRQLPFRFSMVYEMLGGWDMSSAYDYDPLPHAANSEHVNMLLSAIEKAADIACENVDPIPGLTVVFSDNSGSMSSAISERSKMSCAMAANTLCGIIAKRCARGIVCAFGTDVGEVRFTKKTSVIDIARRVARADTKGMFTNGHRCIQWVQSKGLKPDRIIVLSDMQCWTDGGGWRGYSDTNMSDAWQRFIKTSPDTWMHSVHINGYGDTPVAKGVGNVNLVGGFSEKIVNMLLKTEGVVDETGEAKAIPTLDQLRENW